jgi:cytochrome b subunit of formate dehydrogenase
MRTAYAALLLALTLGATAPLGAQEGPAVPAICADCHEGVRDKHLGALGHAEEITCLTCHHIGLTNDPVLEESLRQDACVSCHEETDDAHVASSHVDVDGASPSCMDCHSVHADPSPAEADVSISRRCASCHVEVEHTLHATVTDDAPACTECHTSHSGDVFHPEQASLYEGCSTCHEATHRAHAEAAEDFACTVCHGASGPSAADAADDLSQQCGVCHTDIHPSHSEVGDEGSPSCLDCHDFEMDSPMEMAGPATSARCAECHEDAMDGFTTGGHAEGLGEDPNADLPTCVTCHQSHMDAGQDRSLLRLAATVRCVECHSQELLVDAYGLPLVADSYEDDFHGATARFMWSHPEAGAELPPIMVCSDCHGAHSVGWSEDDVVADVCRQCHEESDDYLAGAWLGHGEIGPRHQPLIFLVKLGYYALIPFMLIGLMITIFFHLRTERRHGARVMRTAGMQRLIAKLKGEPRKPEEMVQRFSLSDRWEHAGSAITFILLVVTGLPQTRPDWMAARWLIEAMGGIGSTRIIHRVVGFTFVALMLSHVVQAVIRAVRRHRLPVMMPVRKDFEDIVQTFRHYVLGEKLPKVGKFDFAEKYEYWGLFLGGIVMSATGVVLVFPELVTQFLPGIIVAAIRVVHGFEATFAVSVVILWHSWGVMLRPEVFPLDTTIFSGKMSVTRLKHEHPLEYERLFPDRVQEEREEEASEGPANLLPGHEEGLAGA